MISIRDLLNRYAKMSNMGKATLWFLLCNVLQRGLSVITVPIFTRIMSTEQYGYVTVYNSWLQILLLICTLRLDYGVFYKGLSKFKEQKHDYTITMQSFHLYPQLFA